MTAVTVHGTVADGFESLRDELAAAPAGEPDDPGAQLVVALQNDRLAAAVLRSASG